MLKMDTLCLLAMPGCAPKRMRASHSAVWPLKYASRRAEGREGAHSMGMTHVASASPLFPSLSGAFRGKFGTAANNTEKMAAAFS